MIPAFYLLAVSAVLLYVNVNTVVRPYDRVSRWRKNAAWYGWQGAFVASLVAAVLDVTL